MRRLLPVLAVVALIAAACRSDHVVLRYEYGTQATSHLEYVMTAEADARWNIGKPGSGSYSVTFRVTEDIQAQGDGTAIVSVVMVPERVEENGLISPGSERRTFSLEIGPEGEQLRVLKVDGIPAAELDDDQLALIGTYRPPLPQSPVRLHDSWDARRRVAAGSVVQQISTTGILDGLHRDGRQHRIAQLGYSGGGDVTQSLTLPQGRAALTGTTNLEISAELDIDDGALLRSSSHTRGTFDARVVPENKEAPITGTLQLDLSLHVRRV
ncbi:MAG TPA: hypothetical protein VFK89_02645 [Actinomycetota bacterium]|nr:hypothetical protein [Actinomycetota bacterium]